MINLSPNRWRNLCALAALSLLAACVAQSQARILSPQDHGMTCPTPTICVEDPQSFARAQSLYTQATAYVERTMVPFQTQPRILFCNTPECAQRFGLGRARGINLGTFGAVIADDGWQNYIVRHEMIHHVQNEVFGVFAASRTLPRWFIEGMAYARSGDPRRPFPIPAIEAQIAQYDAWTQAGNTWRDAP